MIEPLILISNDDGVFSAGIRSLALALRPLGTIVVVAPSTDQSAISHAISLNRPLRLKEEPTIMQDKGEITVFSVDGTPTDAVYMGVHHVLKGRRPDLVVSGINHGGNLGYDVLYSGTVSAAMEGAMLGIPAIAMSLVSNHNHDFSYASDFAYGFCEQILKGTWPEKTLFNVNIPKRIQQPGFAITRLGSHEYTTDVEERKDPRGSKYYWIGGTWSGYHDLPGSDCRAIAQGIISVTPIQLDLTHYPLLDRVSALTVNGHKAKPLYKEEKSVEDIQN